MSAPERGLRILSSKMVEKFDDGFLSSSNGPVDFPSRSGYVGLKRVREHETGADEVEGGNKERNVMKASGSRSVALRPVKRRAEMALQDASDACHSERDTSGQEAKRKRTKSGGRRCIEPGCEKSSAGASGKCKPHGGGRRCDEPGCEKLSQGASGKCIAHGGGQRCSEAGCEKLSAGAGGKCKAHGGGRRCD